MSKSEAIREWIRSRFEENFDFSNRELTKQKFKEHFESDENQKLGINFDKHRSLFIDMLKGVCREKKIDPTTYGYSREKVSFTRSSNDSTLNVTPKPKSSTKPESTETKSDLTAKTSTESTTSEQSTITPLTDDESVKLVRIIAKIGGNVLHAWKDKFEKFDNEELDELAVGCNPLLKPYLEKHGGKVLVALGSILSVMSNKNRLKVFSSKKKKKDDDEDEDEDETDTKTDNSNFNKWSKDH